MSKPAEHLTPVGTVELIDLPDQRLQGVPAKIDTGADSSSIWASRIREKDGRLSFVLFDKASPLYNGQLIVVDDYKVVSVRNSFGQAEYRYKVKMNVVLTGRTIKAAFTLANRSGNRYSVLIGRKTLHGKFVVDVTRKPAKDSMTVLMLSTKRTDVTQRFADNIASHDARMQVTYAAYEDLEYRFGMPESCIELREGGIDIADFDFVYFKTTSRYMDVAAAAARYLEKRDRPFLDRAVKHFPATSKLYQYALLEGSGLHVPPTVYMLPSVLAGSFDAISGTLGLPFVLKDIHGNKGQHNYVVRDRRSFDEACAITATAGVHCVAQAFVPNDCDYRVLVLGAKIALVVKRTRADDTTHLNNTSQGAEAALVPASTFPLAIQKACIDGARLVERQVAGVDIVQDKMTGMWYCLEVNDGPQLASGSFTAEKHAVLAQYLKRRLS